MSEETIKGQECLDIIVETREQDKETALVHSRIELEERESAMTFDPSGPAADSKYSGDGWGVLFVSVGAIVGALVRWKIQTSFGGINVAFTKWSTLGINAVGSCLLGAITALGTNLARPVTLCVGVGFCGAFTTFSTFSVDIIKALDTRSYGDAAILFFLTNILSVGFAALSFYLVMMVQ